MSSRRNLFGGAITMDLPTDFIDASDLRQVPDTQEVFLDPESDMSIIVEVLERVDVQDAENAIKFHFDSLAHDNSAISQQIFEVILPAEPEKTPPLETPDPIMLHGEQLVQKFNNTTPDRVCLFVALFRIEAKGVDLVLTLNMPLPLPTDEEDTQPEEDAILRNSKEKFDLAVMSLRIVDLGLFA